MNKKEKEEIEKEIFLRAYIVFLSVWVVIICNTLAKLGYDSLLYYFFLCLTLTVFYCVILYKHKVQK